MQVSATNVSGRSAAPAAYITIVIVACLAVVPMIIFGNPRGHDFDLQIPGWLEAGQQLSQGILFPLWAAGANHGFGAPFFVFYPPLSRTIGALLGLCLSWTIAPKVYVALALTVAGLCMYKLAGTWLSHRYALVAALLYSCSPYLLLTIYKRSDYAELLGSALFPLLLWAAMKVVHGDREGVVPLAVALATIWVTDLPAAVIASYSLAGLLVVGAAVFRSPRALAWGAFAIVAGFGLIAFFLLPAAWERQWVNIGETVKLVWMPEHNFLFDRTNVSHYRDFNRGLSFFALIVIIITVVTAGFCREFRERAPKDWKTLAIFGALAALMMFPPVLILYRILPELHYIQFPWRWFSPLCVVYALFTAAAIAQARKKWLLWPMAFVVVAMSAIIVRTTWWDSGNRHLQELLAGMPQHLENNGATWSSPLGSQPSTLNQATPPVVVIQPDLGAYIPAQITLHTWVANRKAFSVRTARPAVVAVKLLNYPAWHATVNGMSFPLSRSDDSGQMLIALPAGFSQVDIWFAMTLDRQIGLTLSIATLIVLVIFAQQTQRDSRRAVSRICLSDMSPETAPSIRGASVSAKIG